jgi:hypothetical protein
MAYTYLIGWSHHNKWYYGVRYSKNCEIGDIWKTYFTSSKYVKKFREQFGEPDIVEIRKIFKNKQEALIWETKVLTRLKVIRDDKWLNQTTNKAIDNSKWVPTEEQERNRREKLSEALKGKKLSEAHKLAQSRGKMGRTWWNNGIEEIKSKYHPGEGYVEGRVYRPNDETRKLIGLKSLGNKHNVGRIQTKESNEKRSRTQSGVPKTEEHKRKIGDSHLGKTFSEERKCQISIQRIESGCAKGNKNPMYGKKGNLSPSYGKKWWNNGQEEVFSTSCPLLFTSGRLKKHQRRPSQVLEHQS